MFEIKIKKIDEQNEMTFVLVDLENIPAVDIPYFVAFENLNTGLRKLEFQFLNNSEQKDIYKDSYLKLIYGKKSGKIYEFELFKDAYINNNKIKEVRKKVVSFRENNRFKNNISTGLEIIKDVFEKEINE